MKRLTLILIIFALAVVACGGGNGDEEEEPAAAPGVTGDASAGETLFGQTLIGSLPGCVTCHSLEAGQVLVGPSLAGVGARAGSQVSGQSAEAYLRASLQNPDEFTVDGFSAGVMPAALGDELSDQQVADLVAFLLTLK